METNIVHENPENPWLSVVIPIYNAEKYLTTCLKSISAQSFCNYEVILVDDGSTDRSSDICKKISRTDNRFKYYRTINRGVMQARLFGMNRVKGKYFTFCDADDYYANTKVFESLYYKARRIKEPFSFVQFCNYRKFNHLSKLDKYVKQAMYIDADRFYSDEYPLLLCSRWEGSHLSVTVWNKMYDSRLIDNIQSLNISRKIFWGEDQIINMFLLQKITGAYYISEPYYVYRESTGGTGRFSMTTMEDLNTIKTYQLDFLAKKGHLDADRIRQYLFAEMAAWSALYIRQAGNYLDGKQLKLHIKDMLNLPTFIQAKRYYSEHPEAWVEAEMIQRAQVQDYVMYAEKKEKKTLKNRVIKCLKRIYKSI